MKTATVNSNNKLSGSRSPRRGMTVIVVLGVISITLALSYAMLRSQVTSVEIQSNLDRRNAARQAAYAGISAAIRKMHQSSWGGVAVPLNQDLTDNQWFEVSFETGDSSLTSSSTDWAEYPFRVTIHSTGFASDPAQPDVRSIYKVRTVVQLLRKKLTDPPAAWTTIQNYTSYQWSGGIGFLEFPVQVSGPVWTQNQLFIASDYPTDSGSRTQYLTDLNAMRVAGLGDYRPFTGPLNTPHSKQGATMMTLLQSTLGLSVNNIATATSQPITFPTSISSYQLYPGGKSYDIPVLQSTYGDTLSGITLAPDQVNNPLAIYASNDVLKISNNVSINGTIIAKSGSEPDVRILGTNVVLAGGTLPALYGSTTTYRMPLAVVKDDFLVYEAASATARGAVVAWDEFSFIRGDNAATFDMKGHAVSSRMNLYGRIPWDLATAVWSLENTLYQVQKLVAGGVRYFPQWMKLRYSMNHQPSLKIQPDAATIVDHWHVWGQPVYCVHPSDPGLRWDVVDWVDNPH